MEHLSQRKSEGKESLASYETILTARLKQLTDDWLKRVYERSRDLQLSQRESNSPCTQPPLISLMIHIGYWPVGGRISS